MTNVDFGRYKRIVQYFWDPEPKNDDVSKAPIWCLGLQYTSVAALTYTDPSKTAFSGEGQAENVETPGPHSNGESYYDNDRAKDEALKGGDADGAWPPMFLDDFESRVWLTYRSNFPPIARSQDPGASSTMSFSVRLRTQLVDQGGFTTDAGWGCMIRSGQSLLANALFMLHLGREWRRGTRLDEERSLLSLFADDPEAPFSIHRFVSHGASACGKHPGEWFGPSATARCIQALSNEYRGTGLNIYFTGDGSDVYEDSFMSVAKADAHDFRPTLVLVGIRLGIDRVTPVYWEALKASVQLPQSVGIAGGRPSSSHYFVGVQGPYFFYLDPHHTRPALPLHNTPGLYSTEDIDFCHTRRLRRLHISEMDPSMLIAFLIRDEDDWEAWRQSVCQVQGKPIINVADKAPLLHGHGFEREGAVDEVETFDDDNDDDDDLTG